MLVPPLDEITKAQRAKLSERMTLGYNAHATPMRSCSTGGASSRRSAGELCSSQRIPRGTEARFWLRRSSGPLPQRLADGPFAVLDRTYARGRKRTLAQRAGQASNTTLGLGRFIGGRAGPLRPKDQGRFVQLGARSRPNRAKFLYPNAISIHPSGGSEPIQSAERSSAMADSGF